MSCCSCSGSSNSSNSNSIGNWFYGVVLIIGICLVIVWLAMWIQLMVVNSGNGDFLASSVDSSGDDGTEIFYDATIVVLAVISVFMITWAVLHWINVATINKRLGDLKQAMGSATMSSQDLDKINPSWLNGSVGGDSARPNFSDSGGFV